MTKHVCPWWLAYTFDNPLRRLFHKPETILGPYLKKGSTAVDLGCGMGFFSIGMARIVGDQGLVLAVDLQQKMLDVMLKRARREEVSERITAIKCTEDNISVTEKVDFALSFWMAHETPDELSFFKQVIAILRSSGKLLVAEPKLHVTKDEFGKTLALAEKAGLRLIGSPVIKFSHTALFEKA